MNPMFSRLCCVLVAGVLFNAAHAQPPSPLAPGVAPSLKSAVEAAWMRAVEATDAEGQLARAHAGRAAATTLWAAPPALELSHRDDRLTGNAGQRESEIGVAWPLLLPGQRAARTSTADAELTVAEAYQRAAKLRLAGEVREAAWTVSARRAELRLLQTQLSTLDALAGDVDRRVAAGDLARADALAARAEVLAARALSSEAQQGVQAAESRWRVLTGVEPLQVPVEPAPHSPVANHPELVLAGLEVERARARAALLRVSRSDPPELRVGVREDVPGRGLGAQSSIGVAVRVPFGTRDRNLPREAAASSAVDLALAQERRLRDRLQAEAAVTRAGVEAAALQLAAEESRVGALRERSKLLDTSFRAGETSLPELLRAMGTTTQAEVGAARAGLAVGLARSRLQQTLGIIP